MDVLDCMGRMDCDDEGEPGTTAFFLKHAKLKKQMEDMEARA